MNDFSQIIRSGIICLNLTEQDGEAIVSRLVHAAVEKKCLEAQHEDAAVQAIMRREWSASTAMPGGIALPHGRVDFVSSVICMIGIHPTGALFGAPDNERTHIFLQLLVPASAGAQHIQFLAKISRKLLVPATFDRLLRAATPEDVFSALEQD
jgi:PTS system fructose-specific IIC component